jgi:hypothetical protein
MFKTNHVHESKTLTSAQDATLQVPVYGTIHDLMLRFATAAGADGAEADIRSEISNIRVSLSGRDIINASTARLLDLYEAMSVNVGTPAAVAGVVELNIGRLLFTDPVARDVFALGTKDQTSIQITVTAGTLVNIASVQAFTSRTPEEKPLGAHCKFINYVQSFNSTGDHTVDTLPRDLNTAYLAVLVDDGAAGTITHGECRRNSLTIKERLRSSVNSLTLSNNRQAQPAGYFLYSFCDGSLASNLPMQGTTDLRFIQTFSVAPGAAGYNVAALTVVNPPAIG